jgi:hypothetical protein
VYLTADTTVTAWAEQVCREGRVSLIGLPVLSR